MKRQPVDWKKRFANHKCSIKDLYPEHKEFLKLKNKKTTNLVFKEEDKRSAQTPHKRIYVNGKQAYQKLFTS